MRAIKWFFQKIFRGYSDPEIWGLDYTIAKFIYPRLRIFKQHLHGYPSDLDERKWAEILDKILWAMKFIMDDEDYPHHIEDMEECERKCDAGCKLLGQHFRGLWD